MILLTINHQDNTGILFIMDGGIPSVLNDIKVKKTESIYIVSGTTEEGTTCVTLPVGQTILLEYNEDGK